MTLAAVVANLALVAVAAGPAAAHHVPPPGSPAVASGTVAGTELLENQHLDGCFTVTQQIFGWQGQGTYAGKTPDGQDVVYKAELAPGQALHEGPLKFTVDTHGPYYHGPKGTHGMTDSTCSAATAGSPITGATFTILAAGHVYKLDGGGAQVPCTGTGSWARLGGDWHAQWALDSDCTVVGNAAGTPGIGIARAQTVHTHQGTHDPCFNTCFDNFRLDYTQHPPVEGLFASVTGPNLIALNRSAAMTAVVSYDGAPLSGASVAFSVSGPGTATPSSGTVTTGSTGQAGFSFSAGVEGNYVVTATGTSSAYPGEEKTATFTVFFSGPRPRIILGAQPKAQNGDVVMVEARLVDDSDPVAGGTTSDPLRNVAVNFSVAAPAGGQALPASDTQVTDTIGHARFNFTGTRAGTYTVTASAAYAGRNASTDQAVEFVVNTASQVGTFGLPNSGPFVVDRTLTFGYLGTSSSNPAKVRKIDLNTFAQVGEITLSSANKEWNLSAGAIDPAGDFAYFGTGRGTSPSTWAEPGRVVKIDLRTFERVGAITLPVGETWLTGPSIDPAGDFAYFTMVGSPKVVKIDLHTFERVGVMEIPEMPRGPSTFKIEPTGRYAYISGETVVNGGGPGLIIKVDLSTLQRVGELELDEMPNGPSDPEDRRIAAVVIDPEWHYAYYGSNSSNTPSHNWIIKVDLTTLQRVSSAPVPYIGVEEAPWFSGSFIDPAGKFAYFAAQKWVIKIELATMEMTHIPITTTAPSVSFSFLEPQGEYAYFRTSNPPLEMIKFDLTRPPKAALAADNESYSTPYVTPLTVAAPGVLANDSDTEDADPLVTFEPSNPAGGSVSMSPDGSFIYTPDVGFTGTDTFTYQASDGIDLSPPATVTITVAAPPARVQSVSGGACAYYTDVSLFGGASERRGCDQTVVNSAGASPSVTLPLTGSGGPLTATKTEGAIALYGPAALFSGIWTDDLAAPPPSGPLSASTQGSTGPGGSAASSAHAVLHDTPLPVRCDGEPVGTTNCTAPGGIGPGPLIADEAHSTCTANESGITASATFVEGILETKYDAATQLPIVVADVPENPAPNYTVEGTLDHVGDSFRVVFNEQIVTGDSITVNAAHMYLLGPTAVGDMIIAQSRCGAEIAPPAVSVSASPSTVSAGDAVTATWSAIETPGPTDWVGLYPAGDTPEPGLIAWSYTNGTAAGSLNLVVPAGSPPGTTYELRLFRNNSYERLATSAPFSVVASSVAISASPSSVNPGAPVTATYSGISAPTATDWVGLYDSSSATEPALLGWAYTNGTAAGSVQLFVPGGAALGATYELRLFTNNSYTRIATSAPFSVVASTATLSASPSTTNPGAPLTATWTGIGAPSGTDWVGLYDSSSTPNHGLLAWAYTNGGADGSVSLFVPAGAALGSTYELRLFTNNSYTRLATSAPFSVAVSNATISASPSSVAAGSAVTATWSGIAAPNATDWVGLYPTSATADPGLVAWAYTGGAADGSLNLTVPPGSPPGATYELRLYANNSYTRLATSSSFAVT